MANLTLYFVIFYKSIHLSKYVFRLTKYEFLIVFQSLCTLEIRCYLETKESNFYNIATELSTDSDFFVLSYLHVHFVILNIFLVSKNFVRFFGCTKSLFKPFNEKTPFRKLAENHPQAMRSYKLLGSSNSVRIRVL